MGQRDFETKLYYQLSLDQLVPQDLAATGLLFVTGRIGSLPSERSSSGAERRVR